MRVNSTTLCTTVRLLVVRVPGQHPRAGVALLVRGPHQPPLPGTDLPNLPVPCTGLQVWKILCGYLPTGKSDEALRRKREEYNGYVNQYFNIKEEDIHKDTFR